ncbi:LLM-partnered FMN reductase, CE1759 family [Corynebacterium mustelae]|uniref:LLM-partnered FMN reductase, CE1759 family n=1 Tax=Corynebacterium mustelae TaxID=571915 RepID=A0A0G3H576_9CORY|nr:CE1759 family FMN reductase [Corynebacterium mustelae]AKK06252.1 LLM-partnered FMN reductase, CE1759 family [Corynebacterium mustelae]
MKQLVVLNAGLSTPSTTKMLSQKISGSVTAEVTNRGEGLNVIDIDINNYVMDLATVMATGVYSEKLREALDQVAAADALIAVTPVFSASYAGVFKMFIDVLDLEALIDTPVIIAATAGTGRHSLVLEYALRPLFAYLKAVVMPTAVFAATDDFGAESELDGRIAKAARQLAAYLVEKGDSVGGLSQNFSQRKKPTASSMSADDVVPFSNLLQGHDGNS